MVRCIADNTIPAHFLRLRGQMYKCALGRGKFIGTRNVGQAFKRQGVSATDTPIPLCKQGVERHTGDGKKQEERSHNMMELMREQCFFGISREVGFGYKFSVVF